MAGKGEAEKIDRLFQKAYEDNVDINLMFLLDKCQFADVRGPCVMVKNRHFVVRIPLAELDRTQIVWGAEVDGYFAVRIDDLKPVHFRSRLVRMYNAPPDSMFLIFPYPEHIDHEERRNSRRVNIDRESAHGFGVWYGMLEGGDLTAIPKQVWRALENSECELGEISASGMRLDFAPGAAIANTISAGDRILLKGDFGTEARPSPVFVLGTVARKMPRRDREGWTEVGVHFGSFRHLLGQNSERWFRAHPQEGIGLINQWLRRRLVAPALV